MGMRTPSHENTAGISASEKPGDQSPGFALVIDRRRGSWQEVQLEFDKIITLFPAKIKEVFLLYQCNEGGITQGLHCNPLHWSQRRTTLFYLMPGIAHYLILPGKHHKHTSTAMQCIKYINTLSVRSKK